MTRRPTIRTLLGLVVGLVLFTPLLLTVTGELSAVGTAQSAAAFHAASADIPYSYDDPPQLVVAARVASQIANTTTTPPPNSRTAALAARTGPRTSSGVVRLISGCCVAARGAARAFEIDDSQFGAKIAKHAYDYGLDPSSAADRAALRGIIEDVGTNPERVVEGTFRGQGAGGARGPVEFRIKGEDVVVTSPQGRFVTILKGGINNPSVKRALGGE